MGSSRIAACFCLALLVSFSADSPVESAITPQVALSWPIGDSVQVSVNSSTVNSPMISSATNQFYLAVQGSNSGDGADKFCWIAVMDQSDATNHQQVWRAPCDPELQRLNANESCFFGLSSGGDLILSLGDSFVGGRIAFSNGTSNADHAVVSDWGRILLQDAANATTWNSADTTPPPSTCLGPFN